MNNSHVTLIRIPENVSNNYVYRILICLLYIIDIFYLKMLYLMKKIIIAMVTCPDDALDAAIRPHQSKIAIICV